jgi:hypothetical protein
MTNPWQQHGVSILSEDISDLMPIVGQKPLYEKLVTFYNGIQSHAGRSGNMTGFFIVIGGWGLGKSRVGHEICLEAISDEVNWIVDSNAGRIMTPGLRGPGAVLPIFIRYIQMTRGPMGPDLNSDNWIASAIVEALARLAKMRDTTETNRFVRNQDVILQHTRKVLEPKGWASILPQLKTVLAIPEPGKAARAAIDILKSIGIDHLMLVVDEIEDITDIERDGLSTTEREGIDQGLLTVIPRVIKAEEGRMDFPEVNFLLLCSQAVGDLLKQVRAIERRTGWHELSANTFADVQDFFQYLAAQRPKVSQAMAAYPPGLRESAFFAANRNFGWFNVIMHYAHENHRQGNMNTPGLLYNFARHAAVGSGRSVFDLSAISEYNIDQDGDKELIIQRIFELLPREIGPGPHQMPPAEAERLLTKIDAAGKPIFTRLMEIAPPRKTTIKGHFLQSGYVTGAHSNELVMLGETRFEIDEVIRSLEAYSINLPTERAGNLLICVDEAEFVAQISGLSPYPEQADRIAPDLFGLLSNPSYRYTNPHGQSANYVGPAFSFLLKFNRLNKIRQEEQGYLRDSIKNSALQKAFESTSRDKTTRISKLLKGLANCWAGERAPVAVIAHTKTKLPVITWTPGSRPLSYGLIGSAAMVYATGVSESDLSHDLLRLAQDAAAPTLLILENEDHRVNELASWIERTVPALFPCVIIHNLSTINADHMVRIGLLGDVFQPEDLRTQHFHGVIGRTREHLSRNLEDWKAEKLDARGLLLSPMFYGSKITTDDLTAFAVGYFSLLGGADFDALIDGVSDVFVDLAQRDRFKKLVDRHVDPGPKFKQCPRESLIEKDDGIYRPRLPRVLLAVLRALGPTARRQSELEQSFLFDVLDDKNEEVAKPRDVLRHLVEILKALGVLSGDGDMIRLVSRHQLRKQVENARNWLAGPFVKEVETVRRQNLAAAAALDLKYKEAVNRLKSAEIKLQGLDLDFIQKPWFDLNRETAGDEAVYADRLKAALTAIYDVRKDISWVYDEEAYRLFSYSTDALNQFAQTEGTAAYPLWKRTRVLAGFYQQVASECRDLITRIDAVEKDIKNRIPELTQGPGAGQKAFPIQALTLPLSLFQQELSFSADRPEKSIMAGSTTLGVKSLGYKLADEKYPEALERLKYIRSELFDPGKLVNSFLLAVDEWEALCKKVKQIEKAHAELDAFFTDAPEMVKSQVNLTNIGKQVKTLCQEVCEGGIRFSTDDREAAGVRVDKLIDGLKTDLAKLADRPGQILEIISDVRLQVLPSLEARYQLEYGVKLRAFTKIRRVQAKPLPNWPQQLAATYGTTAALFDDLVATMDVEGEAFFAECPETRFADFEGLCRLEADGGPINWEDSAIARHIQELKRLKLVEFRLV